MKIFIKSFFCAGTLLCWIFSQAPLLQAVVQANPPAPNDERRIEREREEAIFEALASVNPAIREKESQDMAGTVTAFDQKEINYQVEKLRRERKAQFKHLTWSHIKQMITSETVLAKSKFLQERDKNLGKVLERAVNVHVPAQVARERMGLAKFRI